MATCTLPLLSLFLLATLLHTSTGTTNAGAGTCATKPDSGSTLRIIHAFGPCSPLRPAVPLPPWADFLTDQTERDTTRLLFLNSLATTGTGKSFVPVAAGRQLLQVPNYIVRGNLGTPAQNLLLAFDTSNDAAWIPCSGCVGCPAGSPYFNPTTSKSYRPIPCGSSQCSQAPNPTCYPGTKSCSFNFSYAASSFEAGLGQDSLSLASDIVSSYTFGCLLKVSGNSLPPQGLLGLGRGPLSFLTQTKSIYGSTFSYCLPSFKSLNFSGTLRLGTKGQPVRIKTTPLLLNPHRSSLYYVNMTGIKVGRHVVPIPPSALAFDPNTGAGTVIDSGTMFTQLVRPAYEAMRLEFRRQVKAPYTSLGGFDTCYNGPVTYPPITLIFDGMQVTLPEDNVIIHSTAGTISCLAMAAAPEGVNAVLNVIANMQQQNHRILFDVPNSRVGFAREVSVLQNCDDGSVTKDMISLSIGPDPRAQSYNRYLINGVLFRTKEAEERLTTQNSGIVVSSNLDDGFVNWYGVIRKILVLEYIGRRKVVLFECDWFEKQPSHRQRGRSYKIDEYGFVDIDVSQLYYQDDPYVLGNQAEQVYYVKCIKQSNWVTAIRTTPRYMYAMPTRDVANNNDAAEEVVNLCRNDIEGVSVSADVVPDANEGSGDSDADSNDLIYSDSDDEPAGAGDEAESSSSLFGSMINSFIG